MTYYQCKECKLIYEKKPKGCKGCTSKVFYLREKFSIDDIVQLIDQFTEVGDRDPFGDGIEYWDLFDYVESFAGEVAYLMFDKALQKGQEKNLFWKSIRIYWLD